jgi:oligoendopeptidase F
MESLSKELKIPAKKSRRFLPEDFRAEEWESIRPYFENLLHREIGTAEDLWNWFKDRSELESVISEEVGWRYIKMTCDTTDKECQDRFNHFISEIEPLIAPYSHQLNEKALNNLYLSQINQDGFEVLKRSLKKEFEIFREENIPLNTEIQTLSQQYGAIAGAMTVEIDGKELTLQQAGDLLESSDRAVRQEAYMKISERRLQDKDQLDALYHKLIELRDKTAKNADFPNYRDYMFAALGRFDYTPQLCFDFHHAVSEEVVPILNELAKERKTLLGLDVLKPWDKSVDPTGKPALRPFKNTHELTERTIECFHRLDPFLGYCLKVMQAMGHLDLDSRKGKAPGGYNYPLDETGVPFIFMNATSNLRDLVTILHEGGHAVHSILTKDLELSDFKHAPSEIAELASMSMELISMDHWDLFFESEDDLKRAKKEHLEQIIETLPWVAIIDKFQHWVYENPGHSIEERKKEWVSIYDHFSDSQTDWTGLEQNKAYLWQKQLHLYEVPFYYIEYAIAQLGAIAVWKNYRQNPQKGLQGYMNALKLGYLRPIPEVYAAADIKFDFSREYIRELIGFVKKELDSI